MNVEKARIKLGAAYPRWRTFQWTGYWRVYSSESLDNKDCIGGPKTAEDAAIIDAAQRLTPPAPEPCKNCGGRDIQCDVCENTRKRIEPSDFNACPHGNPYPGECLLCDDAEPAQFQNSAKTELAALHDSREQFEEWWSKPLEIEYLTPQMGKEVAFAAWQASRAGVATATLQKALEAVNKNYKTPFGTFDRWDRGYEAGKNMAESAIQSLIDEVK